MNSSQDYVNEIVRLHIFFEEWFLGKVEQNDAEFARFSDAMSANFHIVSPGGDMAARPQLIKGLWGAHNHAVQFEIEIKNAQLLQKFDDLALMTYEEWQITAAGQTARLSTVLLQDKPGSRFGVEWHHVHETWISIASE